MNRWLLETTLVMTEDAPIDLCPPLIEPWKDQKERERLHADLDELIRKFARKKIVVGKK